LSKMEALNSNSYLIQSIVSIAKSVSWHPPLSSTRRSIDHHTSSSLSHFGSVSLLLCQI
jgi:hypothetical protein